MTNCDKTEIKLEVTKCNPLTVPIFPNTVNRSQAVFEADFLTFFDGARTVGNRYFMNANAEITNFGGDFWLEAIAVFPECRFC